MIPTPPFRIPPPPRKNRLWEIYSKGEKLTPTYDPIPLKTKVIPPPPRCQEPRSIKYGGLDLTDKIVFVIAIVAMLTIGIYGSFFYQNR